MWLLVDGDLAFAKEFRQMLLRISVFAQACTPNELLTYTEQLAPSAVLILRPHLIENSAALEGAFLDAFAEIPFLYVDNERQGGYGLQSIPFISHTQFMKEAALFYHEQLKTNSKNRKAIDVIHSWGISGKTVVKLGLGFNDDSYDSALKYFSQEKKISLESLMRDSIIGKTEKGTYYDRMRNSIIIPTIDLHGNVVCFDYHIVDKGTFSHYPPGQGFYRKENLYSLNLAVKSQKKSVIVVSDYLSYFALVGRGVFNVVSTYMPQISEAQMDLLKKHFKVVILAVNSVADFSACRRFCQKNDMYCDQLQIEGSPSEYISENADNIVRKIDYYESIFNS